MRRSSTSISVTIALTIGTIAAADDEHVARRIVFDALDRAVSLSVDVVDAATD